MIGIKGTGGEDMVFGIGVDSAEVARVAKSIEKYAFLHRVYSEEEQALLEVLGGSHRAETAAANFAAKEAFLKAAGKGIGGFDFAEITALRGEEGAPYYKLYGKAAQWCAQNGLACHLSLTHEAGVATAFALLEQRSATVKNL